MLERVQEDLNRALKAGDKQTVSALRMLVSVLKNAQIETQGKLTQEQSYKIVQKEIKKRIEARDLYQQHDRVEQAAAEEFERQILAQYAPTMLNEQDIDKLITEQSASIENPNFSSLMPLVMKAAAGRADGKIVADRVKVFLS
ncbi:MAG: GatB/YqeY domain-containing protein [Patescibacteria group bacterium]|jgi:hypothetical protein|nr:GatB/YqeY domain-containing protein [Patescibacteria group bacterium]